MNSNTNSGKSFLPNRKHPAHHPPIEQHNRPIIIFLTVCSDKRRPILAKKQVHQRLVDIWKSSAQWKVGRYVIMPDHVHLFCSPVEKEHESISKWITFWKRSVSRSLPNLQPIWQRDFWDTQLRQHESYTEKWHYIRNNPVRAGLVDNAEDWSFQGEVCYLPW